MPEIRGEYHPDVVIELPPCAGAFVVVPMVERHDGMANAIYRFHERRASSGKWLWRLDRVEEWMPPLPPQLRNYDDSTRLPMMDEHGYSATLEADQRRKEWAECEARA